MSYKKFETDDGETLYRPTKHEAELLKEDGIALCAGCTQWHFEIDGNARNLYCHDCHKHQVFGHLQLSTI